MSFSSQSPYILVIKGYRSKFFGTGLELKSESRWVPVLEFRERGLRTNSLPRTPSDQLSGDKMEWARSIGAKSLNEETAAPGLEILLHLKLFSSIRICLLVK